MWRCEQCGQEFRRQRHKTTNRRFCSLRCAGAALHLTEEQFWARVARTDNIEECWLWMGTHHPYGYGVVRFGGRYDGVHRIAYRLHHKCDIGGLCVLHKCDNPPCCNPHHLFLGTKTDNAQDMTAKGRRARGERNGNSKLQEEDVRAVREQRAMLGTSYAVLGKQFNISEAQAGGIVRRDSWAHVT